MSNITFATQTPGIFDLKCYHCKQLTRVLQDSVQNEEAKRWEEKYKQLTMFFDEKVKEGVREKLSELSTMTLSELLEFTEKIKGEQ